MGNEGKVDCIKNPSEHRKRKKRQRSSSTSTSSESTDEKLIEKVLKKLKKLKKKDKRKKKKKKLKECEESNTKNNKKSRINRTIIGVLEKSKNLAPMTKEEWQKQQNTLSRVYDAETGRTRLIRGSGEIVEECVSRDRQRAINKLATVKDGEFFQQVLSSTLK